ncbi:MAG: ParA family protein [Verrucomicrobiota bacterium]
MKIVAIANQKGGVGKTTTAMNLSVCLAELEKSVLLIDLDPQANATSGLGLDTGEARSLYGPLVADGDVESLILATRFPHLSIIPSELDLSGSEIEVARMSNHLTRLREILQPMREKAAFDFVLLDCPPSLGILMTSALAAADELLIPLQAEFFGLEGLAKIVHVSEEIRQSGANPDLILEGIFMTMLDNRTNLGRQVMDEVRTHFPEQLYDTFIPRSIRLGEAPSHGLSIIEHDSTSAGAAAYRSLASEFLRRHRAATAPLTA